MTVEHNSLPALSDHNIVQDLFQMDGYNGTFAAVAERSPAAWTRTPSSSLRPTC